MANNAKIDPTVDAFQEAMDNLANAAAADCSNMAALIETIQSLEAQVRALTTDSNVQPTGTRRRQCLLNYSDLMSVLHCTDEVTGVVEDKTQQASFG